MTTCTHHWRLVDADEKVTHKQCRKCGMDMMYRTPSPSDCTHHWLVSDVTIERDGVRVLPAVCRLCHDERGFPGRPVDDFNGGIHGTKWVPPTHERSDYALADER